MTRLNNTKLWSLAFAAVLFALGTSSLSVAAWVAGGIFSRTGPSNDGTSRRAPSAAS